MLIISITYAINCRTPVHDVYIHVKIPFDPEINKILKGLKARFDGQKKVWVLPVGRFHELKPHIERINESAQLDWHDRVNRTMREHVNDKRIFVDENQVGGFQEGGVVFHNGRDWTVTYVGRKRVMGDKTIKVPVYLSACAPVPLDAPTEDRFR